MNPGRAVVIGSGLSGLATAVLLAEGGWAVTVLEAHGIPGGLLQRYRRGDRWFDTGFHLATGSAPDSILRGICSRLGIADSQTWLAPDMTAQFVVSAPGVEPLAIPVGIAEAEAATARRFPDQGEGIHRFFALLRGRLAANGWLSGLAEGAPVRELPPGDGSVASVLAACGVTGTAATLIGAASGILAMRAESCPFEMFAGFAGSTFSGGWRLAGGGDGLILPLIERLKALDGQLLLRRRATAITHDGVRASSVVDVTGAVHDADLVISTVHPDILQTLVGDQGLRPSFKNRLAEVPDSAGAVMLAAHLSRPAEEIGRRHHFLRLADGGDAYLLAPDLWEPGQPPSLEAMIWVPTEAVAAWRDSRLGRRPAAYEAWKQEQAQRLLTAIGDRWPVVPSLITRSWTASPLTFRDYIGGRHGGSMGLSHDLGHLGSQPLSSRNKLRNLLFSGQSFSHPGILGVLIGACVTAGAVLERDVRAEIRG